MGYPGLSSGNLPVAPVGQQALQVLPELGEQPVQVGLLLGIQAAQHRVDLAGVDSQNLFNQLPPARGQGH